MKFYILLIFSFRAIEIQFLIFLIAEALNKLLKSLAFHRYI